jgi:glycosyltransferase involved in cell wall biosynthesis
MACSAGCRDTAASPAVDIESGRSHDSMLTPRAFSPTDIPRHWLAIIAATISGSNLAPTALFALHGSCLHAVQAPPSECDPSAMSIGLHAFVPGLGYAANEHGRRRGSVLQCGGLDPDAVVSLLAQSYPVSPIICVDDGSTDNSLRVLHDLASRHPDTVRVLYGPNRGGNHARNRGLRELECDFVQFLDADDYLKPQKIERQVLTAERATRAASFIAGRSCWHDAPEDERPGLDRPDDPWEALVHRQLGNTCANLWRRDSLLAVGGWNEKYRSSQETELMFRLLRDGFDDVAYSDQADTVTRRTEGSVSSVPSLEKSRRHVDVRLAILAHLRSSGKLTSDLESALFMQLFRYIRGVHQHSPLAASRYMTTLLGSVSEESIPPSYARYTWLYKRLGYRPVERIAVGMRRLAKWLSMSV